MCVDPGLKFLQGVRRSELEACVATGRLVFKLRITYWKRDVDLLSRGTDVEPKAIMSPQQSYAVQKRKTDHASCVVCADGTGTRFKAKVSA